VTKSDSLAGAVVAVLTFFESCGGGPNFFSIIDAEKSKSAGAVVAVLTFFES